MARGNKNIKLAYTISVSAYKRDNNNVDIHLATKCKQDTYFRPLHPNEPP